MSRRRKNGATDAVTDLVAKLPWWAGVALTIAAYVVLHRIAAPAAVVPLQSPVQAGAPAVQTIILTMAGIGKNILLLFCLIGAALSAHCRHERRGLVERITRNPAVGMLKGMGWQQFEKLVGEGFRRRGYAVKETGGVGTARSFLVTLWI